MFAHILALLPLALLASASHLEARNPCSTGTISCCNSVQSLQSLQYLIAESGVVLPANIGANALLGVTCNPISVIGAGGNSCTSQVACCNGDTFNGLITVGCSPINLNA